MPASVWIKVCADGTAWLIVGGDANLRSLPVGWQRLGARLMRSMATMLRRHHTNRTPLDRALSQTQTAAHVVAGCCVASTSEAIIGALVLVPTVSVLRGKAHDACIDKRAHEQADNRARCRTYCPLSNRG